jgi:anti-sigma factor RsiW
VKPCADFARAIDDAALGEPPSRAFAQHLTTCPACAEQLERRRVLAQRIDGALGAFVRAEPPPELAQRVVASASLERPRRRSAAWPGFRASFAVALVIGFVAGVALGVWRTTHHRADVRTITAWRSPTASLLLSRTSIYATPFGGVRE